MSASVPRRRPPAAGPLRHAPARRPPRRALPPARRDRRRRPRVHRADGHVLPRDRRRRGPAAVLLQGRRAGLRARARRDTPSRSPTTTATGCTCRWATSPSTRTSGCCSSTSPRSGRRGCGSTAWRASTSDDPLVDAYPGRAVRRARAGDAGLPQLPALHPPHGAGGALALRPARRPRAARAGLEADRAGRATCCRRTTRRGASADSGRPEALDDLAVGTRSRRAAPRRSAARHRPRRRSRSSARPRARRAPRPGPRRPRVVAELELEPPGDHEVDLLLRGWRWPSPPLPPLCGGIRRCVTATCSVFEVAGQEAHLARVSAAEHVGHVGEPANRVVAHRATVPEPVEPGGSEVELVQDPRP